MKQVDMPPLNGLDFTFKCTQPDKTFIKMNGIDRYNHQVHKNTAFPCNSRAFSKFCTFQRKPLINFMSTAALLKSSAVAVCYKFKGEKTN